MMVCSVVDNTGVRRRAGFAGRNQTRHPAGPSSVAPVLDALITSTDGRYELTARQRCSPPSLLRPDRHQTPLNPARGRHVTANGCLPTASTASSVDRMNWRERLATVVRSTERLVPVRLSSRTSPDAFNRTAIRRLASTAQRHVAGPGHHAVSQFTVSRLPLVGVPPSNNSTTVR